MTKIGHLLFLLLALSLGLCNSEYWYASPQGDGDCSQSDPCSFSAALSNSGTGTAVLMLEAGTYTITGPITTLGATTIRAEIGGTSVVLDLRSLWWFKPAAALSLWQIILVNLPADLSWTSNTSTFRLDQCILMDQVVGRPDQSYTPLNAQSVTIVNSKLQNLQGPLYRPFSVGSFTYGTLDLENSEVTRGTSKGLFLSVPTMRIVNTKFSSINVTAFGPFISSPPSGSCKLTSSTFSNFNAAHSIVMIYNNNYALSGLNFHQNAGNFLVGTSDSLTMHNSTFTQNSASSFVVFGSPSVNISSWLCSQNTATCLVRTVSAGKITIIDSDISNNVVQGRIVSAMWLRGTGEVLLVNSTVRNNAGVVTVLAQDACCGPNSKLKLNNSVISNNDGQAGGLCSGTSQLTPAFACSSDWQSQVGNFTTFYGSPTGVLAISWQCYTTAPGCGLTSVLRAMPVNAEAFYPGPVVFLPGTYNIPAPTAATPPQIAVPVSAQGEVIWNFGFVGKIDILAPTTIQGITLRNMGTYAIRITTVISTTFADCQFDNATGSPVFELGANFIPVTLLRTNITRFAYPSVIASAQGVKFTFDQVVATGNSFAHVLQGYMLSLQGVRFSGNTYASPFAIKADGYMTVDNSVFSNETMLDRKWPILSLTLYSGTVRNTIITSSRACCIHGVMNAIVINNVTCSNNQMENTAVGFRGPSTQISLLNILGNTINGTACSGLLVNNPESHVSITNSTIVGNKGGVAAVCLPNGQCCQQSSTLTAAHLLVQNNEAIEGNLCYDTLSLCQCNSEWNNVQTCARAPPPPLLALQACDGSYDVCDPRTTDCQMGGMPGRYSCPCKPDFPIRLADNHCTRNGMVLYASPTGANTPASLFACNSSSTPCNIEYLIANTYIGDAIILQPGIYKDWGRAQVLTDVDLNITTLTPHAATFDFGGANPLWELNGGSDNYIHFANIVFRNFSTPLIKTDAPLTFSACEFVDSIYTADEPLISSNLATITVYSTTFANIVQRGYSELIFSTEALVLSGAVFFNNTGGLVYSTGQATISQSTFTRNTMDDEGMLDFEGSASVRVADSTFQDNSVLTPSSDAGVEHCGLMLMVGVPQAWISSTSFSGTNVIGETGCSVVYYSETESFGSLTFDSTTFTNTHGLPISISSGGFTATNMTCALTFNSPCIRFDQYSITASISKSFFYRNSLDADHCGSVALLTDDSTLLEVTESSIYDNDAGLGLFCIDNSAPCTTTPTRVLLESTDIAASNRLAPSGASVFFKGDNAGPCDNTGAIFDQNSPLPANWALLAAPPSQLVVTAGSALEFVSSTASLVSIDFSVEITDVFLNALASTECSDYALCFADSPSHNGFAGTDQVFTCKGGNSSSFDIHFAAPFTGALATTYYLTLTGKNCIGAEKYIAANFTPIEFQIRPPTQEVAPIETTGIPDSIIILIAVVSGLVVLAAIGGLIYWFNIRSGSNYYRFQRKAALDGTQLNQPLITEDTGTLLVDSLTNVLKEAKIPIVEPGEIEILQTIGSGATGVVLSGEWVTHDNMLVAIKQISTSAVSADGWSESRKDQVLELVQELQIMIQMNHPNLLPLLGCCVINTADLRLVLPLMSHGSLASHIETLPAKYVMKVIRQVGWAVEYLHTKNLIHRDLKPENVLLDEKWNAFVADFALSKAINTNMTASILGTPAYMSPELIREGNASKASDVWAFGVICVELIGRARVFKNLRAINVMHQVSVDGVTPTIPDQMLDGATRPKWVPAALISIIQRCFAKVPEERPSFKEICSILK